MSASKLIFLLIFLSRVLLADGWNLDISNNTIYPGNSGNKVLIGGAPQIDGVPLVIKNALAIYGNTYYTEFFAANQSANIFYQLPATQGAGTLTNDGSGNLSWGAGGGSSSPLTTKGDLWGYSSVDARVPIGSNGQVLTADSAQTLGLKWATPAASGLTSVNSDATAAQTLVATSTGTDFTISDPGSGVHNFNLPSASATARGLVTTGAQTLAGAKTLSSAPILSSLTASKLLSLDASKIAINPTVSSPLLYSADTLSCQTASGSLAGCLTSADWTTFNGKLTSINSDATTAQTIAVGSSGTDFAVVDGGSGAHTLNLPSASATARGLVTTGTQTLAGAKTFSSAPKFSSFSTAAPLFTSSVGLVSQDADITWDTTNSLLTFTNTKGGSSDGISFASGPILSQTSGANPNILNWYYNNNTTAEMTWRNPTGSTRAILEMDDPNGTYFELVSKTGAQNIYMEVTPSGTEEHLSASGTLGLQIAGVTKATLNSSGQFNLPALTASSVVVTDSSKNLASSAVTSATLAFLDATSSVQTQINGKQPLDSTLTSLAAYNTNGIVTQTAADTFTGRTITGTSNQISVSNGDGVSGNPTLSTPQDIHTGASPTFVTETLSGLTASRAVATDGSKVLTSSATTATELGYVNGVTSAIQTQLNTKRPIYDATSAIGNCGSSQTVDLSLYNTFTTTLNAATCTFTFSNPTAGGTWLFILTEDGTGGRAVAFASTVNFPGQTTTPPTLSGASRRDHIKIHYDGTNYDASYILNY